MTQGEADDVDVLGNWWMQGRVPIQANCFSPYAVSLVGLCEGTVREDQGRR